MINPQEVFRISNEQEFNQQALAIFQYQYASIPVYRDFINYLKKDVNSIKNYREIPCLPIEFFKSKSIISSGSKPDLIFKSSGTTGARSSHLVKDKRVYESSFRNCFQSFYGNAEDYVFLALLPSYLENGESSLVYMVETLISDSKDMDSGFYLNNFEDLKAKIIALKKKNKKIFLIGVSYALVDFCTLYDVDLSGHIVMETGGMKGRKKELTREELHKILKEGFKVNRIHSEYGMTELLSQAYLQENNLFASPAWFKVLTREISDPFSSSKLGQTGGINIIDLANIDSLSFISTQDLGRVWKEGFEIVGRFDQSDIRGCNLLYI